VEGNYRWRGQFKVKVHASFILFKITFFGGMDLMQHQCRGDAAKRASIAYTKDKMHTDNCAQAAGPCNFSTDDHGLARHLYPKLKVYLCVVLNIHDKTYDKLH
jgi:hypothetical protein